MHVPEPRLHTVRYYGRYANVVRARSRDLTEQTAGPDAPAGAAAETDAVSVAERLRLRRLWAQIIRRIYEVDPLSCPHCGCEMRILAFILDFATARAIRRSLALPAQEPEPLAHAPPETLE